MSSTPPEQPGRPPRSASPGAPATTATVTVVEPPAGAGPPTGAAHMGPPTAAPARPVHAAPVVAAATVRPGTPHAGPLPVHTAPASPGPGRAPEAPAPRSSGRYQGLDLARGIAVLGMVAAHVGYTSTDLSTLAGWLGFSHGRSSILFCLLAGVSLGILTGGRTPYAGVRALQARTRVLVRAVLLLVIGAALAMLDTYVALILGFYAVWFMFSLPFHRWGAQRLLVVGGTWLVVSSVAMPYLVTLFAALGLTTDAWGVNGAVLDGMFGLYPGFTWYGLILVGMGLARLDLRSWKVLLVLLGAGVVAAVAGYGGGHLLRDSVSDSPAHWEEGPGDSYPGEQRSSQMRWLGEEMPDPAWETDDAWAEELDGGAAGDGVRQLPGVPGLTFDTNTDWPQTRTHLEGSAHTATPVEMIGSGGVALAILAVCLLLPRVVQLALLPVRAIGTMSLTAYSAHVVVLAWWPDTFTDWSSASNRPLAILAGGLAVGCLAWYLLLGRGPLERLMHRTSVRAARVDAGAVHPADTGRR